MGLSPAATTQGTSPVIAPAATGIIDPSTGKPVGVICHGPWSLVEADLVRGRTLTSFPSIRTDIRNAGGTWVDEPVVTDGNLITSRNPDDIPAFNKALLDALG